MAATSRWVSSIRSGIDRLYRLEFPTYQPEPRKKRVCSLSCKCTGSLKVSRGLRGLAQLGRASGLGPEGRRFKSCIPDQPL